MSNNPYCKFCFDNLGLNDGFYPEIKKNVNLLDYDSSENYICVDCLVDIITRYNRKYKKFFDITNL